MNIIYKTITPCPANRQAEGRIKFDYWIMETYFSLSEKN